MRLTEDLTVSSEMFSKSPVRWELGVFAKATREGKDGGGVDPDAGLPSVMMVEEEWMEKKRW